MSGRDQRRCISTDEAPAAIGPYSQAVAAGGMLYCSGQIGLLADGTMVGDAVAEQAAQALRNLDAICHAAGTTLAHAVRTTVFLVDLGDFGVVNEIYAKWFAGQPPARAAVEVPALPMSARVEIDAVVWCSQSA
jgi:2-iminobutanoate/2-iminopropanoate deaminase